MGDWEGATPCYSLSKKMNEERYTWLDKDENEILVWVDYDANGKPFKTDIYKNNMLVYTQEAQRLLEEFEVRKAAGRLERVG